MNGTDQNLKKSINKQNGTQTPFLNSKNKNPSRRGVLRVVPPVPEPTL